METLKGNIQTTINMTDSVFIFRSENGKNTCEMCRALDGKQFFPGDEIPVLPLHPNCKCELEKIKSYKDDTEKISDIENEIEEINLLSKELNKKIKDEKFEAQKLNDELDEVENILKTESYDKSKKEEFKTIKKNADDNAQRLIELENKLFYTSAIQNYIKTNLKRLIQAEGQPLEDKILTQSRKDFDAFVGIQHFTIHNPRITKDGYFKAVVYDKYDFEYRTTYNWINLIDFKNIEEIPEKLKNDMFNRLNNLGFFMQEMNLLSNYDIIYYIEQKIW